MDSLEKYHQIILKVLQDYAAMPYSYGNLERRLVIGEDRTNYILLTLGWQNDQRVHGCLIHVEIINNKIWIHRDGTEDGITDDLVAAGISKDQIVLAFHHPEVRQYTGYAIA